MEQTSKHQRFIRKLTEIVEVHISDESFEVSDLAREAGLSQSTLLRRLKKASGQSTNQFIREVRLKTALVLLQEGSNTVAEVAYSVGFGSSSYFSKCFHEYFGYPPGEVGTMLTEEDSTEENPVHAGSPGPVPKRISKAIVLSSFALILLTAILILVLKPFSYKKKQGDNSIAVLPFRNDSGDSINTYFVNGLMEGVVANLAGIEGLDVRSRTSAEAFRHSGKTAPEIGRELNVNYLVEASGQKYGNEVFLNIQLIEAASDRHLLSEKYRSNFESVESLIDLQLNIARDVALKIDTRISPGKKDRKSGLPTENPAAYRLYLQAIAHREMAGFMMGSNQGAGRLREFTIARKQLEQALDLDSTFSDALAGLAHIYIDQFSYNPGLKEQYLDSANRFIDKALEFDPENEYALGMKRYYYMRTGDYESARSLYTRHNKGIYDYKYHAANFTYYIEIGDYYNALSSWFKYQEMKPADEVIPRFRLNRLLAVYNQAGFPDQMKSVAWEIFQESHDSIGYYSALSHAKLRSGNFRKALEFARSAYEIDTTLLRTSRHMVFVYHKLRDYPNALYYLNRSKVLERKLMRPDSLKTLYGIVYLNNGMEEEANIHFRAEIEKHLQQIESNTPSAQRFEDHYSLAYIYSLTGNTEKGLEYLGMLRKAEFINAGIIHDLNYSAAFNTLRENKEFKALSKNLEKKYQKEHEKIRALLLAEGLID